MTSTSKLDLNNIPYDAPLSITEPSWWWTKSSSNRGGNPSRLSPTSLPDVELDGQWVIITGSNNGIGREAALKFAEWGANLILACRNPPPHETHPEQVVRECKERATKEGVESSSIEWWDLDMASLASVEAFAQRWLATGRPLDLLCNNAGMGSSPGGSERVVRTQDGFEIIHQVNFLSHVLLTLRLLPSLQAAAAPRVVCTTSCFHFLGKFDLRNFNAELGPSHAGNEGVQYYQNNKLWFQIWLTELQHRLLQHDATRRITINGVHPGYVASGIWQLNSGTALKTLALKTLAWLFGIDSQQGSYCILAAATSKDAGANKKLQGVGSRKGKGGGRYFNRVWEQDPMPHTKDRDCRLRVWRKVNDELKLQEKGLLDVLGLDADDLE